MRNKISLRQYLILLVVALMPPVVKLVPGKQALIAGKGAWAAALFVLVPMLSAVWLVSGVGKRLPPGTGLGEFLCLTLGAPVGKALCLLYGGWLLLLASTVLRFCAERFVSTIYPDSGMSLFFVAILGVTWYLSSKSLETLARTAQIFFFAVAVTLCVVFAMGMGSVRLHNVWPVWVEDIPQSLRASLPVTAALGIGVSSLFFFGQVTDRRGGRRLALGWSAVLWGIMVVMGVEVMGVFGPQVTSRLEIPFFSLAKEVTLGRAAERVEPLVVAMWVFADVILLGVLFKGAQRAFETAVGTEESGIITVMTLIVLPGAYLVAESSFALETLYDRWLLPGEAVFFYGVPLAAAVVGRIRKKS